MSDVGLKKIHDFLWEIPANGAMRVPARIYASRKMLADITADNAHRQAANVAQLPGIVCASLAMPDIHWGYGFPIGGVAAFDIDEGIVSPGGVGYDINCGVRLMASILKRSDIENVISDLLAALFSAIPTGIGSSVGMKLARKDLESLARKGAAWAVERGMGTQEDLEFLEERGCMADAGPDAVSDRAWERGACQIGTLGSGNHFLEVGYVSDVYDERAARIMGLDADAVTLTIHCGSRGFGHQVCDDYLGVMDRAARRYNIALPDRQLACAPIRSEEGQQYLRAMRCAVNYAFANRQAIAHMARMAFSAALRRPPADIGLRTVYEVAHNIAKIENHTVDGRARRLCVHRKGATRAFAPCSGEIPQAYRSAGQPVLIPGDMGRYSYVLVGTERAMSESFGSACHGAGRRMSRQQALKNARGRDIARELAGRNVVVMAGDRRTLGEEMPDAYKDVADVVEVVVQAGLCRPVARLRPLGCIKG